MWEATAACGCASDLISASPTRVLEGVARAVSRGRVFDVGMRLHHRAAGAQEPIAFAQLVLQLASGRCVSSELENPRSKGLSASGMR